MALKALSEFSALVYKENRDMQVTIKGPNVPKPIRFWIDSQNLFKLHKEEVQTGWSLKALCSCFFLLEYYFNVF